MLRTLYPFTLGLLVMMLGIIESSKLSTRAVEIGHDAILEQANTREQLIKLGVFGAPLSATLVLRGKDTLVHRPKNAPSPHEVVSPTTVISP